MRCEWFVRGGELGFFGRGKRGGAFMWGGVVCLGGGVFVRVEEGYFEVSCAFFSVVGEMEIEGSVMMEKECEEVGLKSENGLLEVSLQVDF